MNKIDVVNIKCGGCAKSIEDKLAKNGFKNVSVNLEKCEVEFDGDVQRAEEILLKMGYPRVGSIEAENLFKKAKSYASCMVGRIKGGK